MNIENVKLTKEMEATLSLYTAIKPVDYFDYTPQVFKNAYPENKELWPVFKCKAVKTTTLLNNSVGSSIGALSVHCVRNGLKAWSNPNNIIGLDFKPEFIEAGVLTDDAINSLSPVLIKDIGLEINYKSALSVNEEISL